VSIDETFAALCALSALTAPSDDIPAAALGCGSLGRPMNESPAPLRAVFLDIGDTVMKPNPSWEDVYAIAFKEFGVEVDIGELNTALRRAYHHGGWGMDGGFEPTEETSFRRTVEIDAMAIAELGLDPMPDEFYRRLAELFMLTSHWHIFPDAYATLAALKERGLTVGAVSNWVWNLPELLHALDLVQHFDFIAASARIGFEKPHPRIFEWALEQAKVDPASVIHVGDHLDADVSGARGVGIEGVLIDRHGRYRNGDLPDGVPVIRSLEELLPIVDARLPDR
jgi:putative hydrolase of the HAD superfamily